MPDLSILSLRGLSVLQRIEARSVVGPTVRPELGPCLDSTHAVNKDGYPKIRDERGRTTTGNRAVLAATLGRSIANGMQALHRCDRRICVRPEHIYEGSPKQNMQDRDARSGNPMQRPDVIARANATKRRNGTAKHSRESYVRAGLHGSLTKRSKRMMELAEGAAPQCRI